MAEIRPLEGSDLPAVANLLRAHLPGWSLDERVLRATVLEHPWADAETPSLVAIHGEHEVVGFMGAQARRMRLGKRHVRAVCCTQLVVDPDRRAGAVGALLIKRLLSGPQEITWSDSSTDVVARVWRTFGGDLDHARAADFMLVLRPLRWAGAVGGSILRGRRVDRRTVPVGAIPLAAGVPFRTARHEPLPAEVRGEEAGAAEIVAILPELSRNLDLYIDWDERQLHHVLGQVEGVEGGLVTRIVRRGDRPIGWYAYLQRPGGASRLLHLAAARRSADQVLGELADDARAAGSAVLAGRAEPHLEWPLRRRLAALGFARQPIVRARDAELAAALAGSSSLLTRLEGEVFAI